MSPGSGASEFVSIMLSSEDVEGDRLIDLEDVFAPLRPLLFVFFDFEIFGEDIISRFACLCRWSVTRFLSLDVFLSLVVLLESLDFLIDGCMLRFTLEVFSESF